MKQRPPLSKPRRPLVTAVAASLLCLTLSPAPLVHAQMPAKRTRAAEQTVTLNFVNAEIDGVARAMGAMLRQQFVVDPRVKGTITLYSEDPMTPREAYLNFLAALRGQGFTVVESGGLYKVVPEADAKLQSNTVSLGAVSRQGDQIITQIFKINHENANNLVPVLRPLISPNNTINANPGNNTLVITDYADNLQRLGKIISAMDVASAGDVEILPIRHGVASDLATMVQKLGDMTGTAGGATPGAPGTSGLSVLADPRSNSLIVRSPNPARMASIRSIVEKLDQPLQGGAAHGNIAVVYLKNADAVKLATVLRAAYGASVSGGNTVGGGSSSGASTPNSPLSALNNTGSANQAGASAAATTPVSASAGPSTGGFIQADPATNSLIITAPEPVYRQLRAVIDQLDSRRAQVYIESMIVEVSGDNAADFGFQWQGLLGNKGDKNIGVLGTNFGSGAGNIITASAATISGLSGTAVGELATSPPGGFNIGLVRDFGNGLYGLAAIARLLQSQTNTNIVSTPNLITLDNEEAKIIVGSNVPFLGSIQLNQGSTSNPFQSVERKDVGITLRIKPQIGEGGTVRMTIFQESSSLSSKVAPGTLNAGPSTDKRSIESTVVVDDGQIIVLGGLIEDKFTDIKNKVPLLGDIPYLGALFRSESRQKTRTNLMVFLRPIVMRDGESANKLSLDRYDLIRGQQRDAQPSHSTIMNINQSPVLPPLQTVTQPGNSLKPETSPSSPAPEPSVPPALSIPPTPATRPAPAETPGSGTAP
jgi:general secretion pathway protein D